MPSQPTAISLFERSNDLLAIYTNTVVYELQLFVSSDALEDLILPTKKLCWRCCSRKDGDNKRRLCFGFGVSAGY